MTTEAFPREGLWLTIVQVPRHLRKFSPFFFVLVRKLGHRAIEPSPPRSIITSDQQPQKIDSRRRHDAVKFPCVYDRGTRCFLAAPRIFAS